MKDILRSGPIILLAASVWFWTLNHYTLQAGNLDTPPVTANLLRESTEKPTSTLQAHDSTHESSSPNSLTSPYEARTGSQLPHWAQKNNPDTLDPTLPQVCFVHVGKTAGSTLGCMLGFDYSCGENSNESLITKGHLLPRLSTHVIHGRVNDCSHDHDPYYLVTLRNPLERIKSWFVYERPTTRHDYYYPKKKLLFIDCPFGTITELAERGLILPKDYTENVIVPDTCRRRAWEAIHGTKAFSGHNYYNYRYYAKQVPQNANILALRSEHLVKDWNSIEAFLTTRHGQNDSPHQIEALPERNKSRYRQAQDKDLTPKAQQLLCKALCPEIQIYKDMLRQAINLTPEQVKLSLDELIESCPVEATVDDCPH